MTLNKILNRKLLCMALVVSVFLILPISFASEDIGINESQAIPIDDESPDSIPTDTAGALSKSDAVYVNSSYDGESRGTIENPAKTIEEGLNLVNDGGTIYLNGEFTGAGNSNITLDGAPDEITFIGADAVINGKNTTTFAVINKGTYTFKNISFIDNFKDGENTTFGGVFHNNEGTLELENCVFENNSVFSVNRANGGAIDNSGTLIVRNSIFRHNNVNISNSSGFRKNAADGGAISNLGTMYIYDSIFEENQALRNGGAIRTQDKSTAVIENCEFNGNIAAYHESGGSYGGAIYCWDGGLDVYNSTFKNNRVIDISRYGAQGGAISYDRSSKKINIQYCQFINNTVEGVGSANGQSLYIGGSANINYCTIDTSIYSASQDIDLNYNWWIVSNSDINALIEMLPSSAKIRVFAELKLTGDFEELKKDETIPIYAKLCWNGTKNQDNINLIPEKTVYITSNCGNLENSSGRLINGTFKTMLTLNSTESTIVTLKVDGAATSFDLKKMDEDKTEMTAACSELTEGETAIISISSASDISGLCLIDIGDNKYYTELVNGKGNAAISNLKAGNYTAFIVYYKDSKINTTTNIAVKEDKTGPVSQINTTIAVSPSFSITAVDYSAGERGTYVRFILNDANGNPLSLKTLQVALDCRIYSVKTDNTGQASLQINLTTARTYTCAVSFSGDGTYGASPLSITKLTVNKKKTSIAASSKSFKVKAKKTVSITLKTQKSKYDGKTYLSKNKKVTLTVKGKTYSAKTNAKGVAKFSVKLTKKGKYTAKIKFAGDGTYKASSKSIKLTVK